MTSTSQPLRPPSQPEVGSHGCFRARYSFSTGPVTNSGTEMPMTARDMTV